uniref:Neuronal membrane glycoprotein M6-b n=1 Tax=Graphocephala atropunctata TaxID=36148 RepID=A0A1B6MFN4_9HEMI
MGRSRRASSVEEVEMVEPSATTPLRRSRYGLSHESIGRFSEHSLHYPYRIQDYKSCGARCDDCLTRIPYATLIATIMCVAGVGIFCGTTHRGVTLTTLMLDEVFHMRLGWLEPVQMLFVILGGCMAALGLMILFVGFLATGATRHRVYQAWTARVSGRISCAVFLGITYVLQLVWLLIFCFLLIVTVTFTTFWALCSSHRVQEEHQCIDFTQFDFVFPRNTRVEDMKVCEAHELKLFCKDYVEKAEVMFIFATVASFIVILSLIHYMMCLAANYAHIRDHEKLQELQELQYLADPDGFTSSKDRF